MRPYRFPVRKRPESVRDSVRKRAGNRCEICGVKPPRNQGGKTRGTIHHRHMRRLGGIDSVENLILLCYPCHRATHKDEITAAQYGFVSWVDPYCTPLLHAAHGWVLLVPDGSVEPLAEGEARRLVGWAGGLDVA